MNINWMIIGGNIVRAVETKSLLNGTIVAEMSVAVNWWRNGQQGTDYIPCVAYGKLAERCKMYLHKGSPVVFTGTIRQESWQGKDGLKHSRLRMVAEDVQFMERRTDGGQMPPAQPLPPSPAPMPYPQTPWQPMPATCQGGPAGMPAQSQADLDAQIPF